MPEPHGADDITLHRIPLEAHVTGWRDKIKKNQTRSQNVFFNSNLKVLINKMVLKLSKEPDPFEKCILIG